MVKRTKIRQSQSTSVNDLPDEILTHILSFLPIKDAFRTTVLSKRWLPLFHSLSVLRFQSDDVQTMDWIDLRRMIDKVMFSSPLAHHVTLKSFHLDCYSVHNVADANAANCLPLHDWIEEAKFRCLQELRLIYLPGIPLKSTTFFCSNTLVVLQLMNSVVSTMFDCSVHLPSLKTLNLSFVQFQDMEDVIKLLSGCPILDNLRTFHVTATSGVTLGGYYKPFSKLITADICLLEMEKSLPNKEINSYYKDFPVFENLTELQLNWFNRHDIYDWNEVVKMLQNCPKLQTLDIGKAKNFTTREDWKYPDRVPECVSSHLTKCVIVYCEAIADFQFAAYILQNASLLQVMKIYSTASDQFLEEDLISCPRISLACKLLLI